MTARECYEKGRLSDAVAAALEEVKQHPTDGGKRLFLVELLCFTGDLERADRQLDVLVQQSPELLLEFNQFRQLIRAEQARQDFYTEGRMPEFPTPDISQDFRARLEASVLLRAGEIAKAAEVLAKAQLERPAVAGACDGEPFDDIVDLDDLNASFFEALTTTGKYYWVPIHCVESVEFQPWSRPRDLLWRQAHLIVRGGPDTDVFIPVLYPGAAREADDLLRLGRATEWRGDAGGPIRGAGQRIFLVGEKDCPILELRSLTFSVKNKQE